MRKRLSKKESWFKENNFTAEDEIYVGVDVHKVRYHVAIWHNGSIGCVYSMSSDNNKLLRDLKRIRGSLKKIVYEAGPTGYSLVRLLRSAKLPAEVVAASKRKRIMRQIKSLLLQHGISWPGGGWNEALLKRLRELDITSELMFTLNQHVDEYEFLCGKIRETNAELRKIFGGERHSAAIIILESRPGAGNIVAWAFRAEMFDITRFKEPEHISKYTGLCPRVGQSGKTCRQGPITKTGRRQLRALLVQAAWAWHRNDPHARQIYNRLLRNTGNGKKAIVGLAKRIAIHLWRMLCDGCLYDANIVKV